MKTTPAQNADLDARICALEEQLAAADRGNACLAARCHALEQKVIDLTPPEEEEKHLALQMTRPTIYFDTGSGYSAQDILQPIQCVHDEKTHTTTAHFTLKKDARALRLDPGELACVVEELSSDDPDLSFVPFRAYPLEDGAQLFSKPDPIYFIEGRSQFEAGTQLQISYVYYPIAPALTDAVVPSLLGAFTQLQKDTNAQIDLQNQALLAARQESDSLRAQLDSMTEQYKALDKEFSSVLSSFCWRITAPLRALLALIHKG